MVFNDHVIHQHGRDDPRASVGGCGDHSAQRGINLVNAQCKAAHPFDDLSKLDLGIADTFQPFLGIRVGDFPFEFLVNFKGTPFYIESPREFTFGMAPDVHGLQHGVPNVRNPFVDFFFRPQGELVFHHNLGDGFVLRIAMLQQFVARSHRMGEGFEGFLILLGMDSLLFDHKTATNGVIGFANRPSVDQIGFKAHTVGMERQKFTDKYDIILKTERNPFFSAKIELLLRLYPVNTS